MHMEDYMPALIEGTTAQTSELMTEAELAALLKVSPKTLANQRTRRVGPPYLKLSGGIVRYSRAAVAAWMEANTIAPGGAVG